VSTASLEELARRRDQLKRKQVRDHARAERLRDRLREVGRWLERRRNRIENLARRIRRKRRRHPTDVSERGLEFITEHEGEVRHTYNDVANNCTSCIGHLHHLGPCSGRQEFSHEQCLDFLRHDVQVTVDAIKKFVTVDLNRNQFDALASFIFNVGTGNFASSTLLRKLNAGKVNQAADQFLRWVFDSNGVAQPGLENRREDERRLFLK
jgi:lysozyme